MMRYSSLCSSYDYGNAEYWNTRYLEEAGASFDWYQRYSALRPFVRKFVPSSSRILMVGCGIALMSEDMVNDGYVDIMNIDISSVVIDILIKSRAHIPQLKYMQMDVRKMSFFLDETFDSVIDKGTLDSLMCGTDAPFSASQMIYEVNRLLKPGGIFMLITYGDPSVRIPHLNQPGCCWKFTLYIIRKSSITSGTFRRFR
ncbi:EEF1A lysine methyltransferase 4-like isoform X3 [Dendrobium catenatum]|uniref:EEF1A lysine methyltransferase 4-like isoform X3 n=1 Tax=Dendrobium catenatum TaxID=906689 RepID=UPI00109FBDD9|nr:EEF1A lysine methyltransferase 4-like isoform X3 [Dendrobium catenatum]